MKIIIIADSLAMPRTDLPYEETWIKVVKNHFKDFDIIDKSARGTTSLRLITEGGGGVDLLEMYCPNFVVLQLGITDCAPRYFNKNSFEYTFLNKYIPPKLRIKYINRIKRKRIRDPLKTEISPEAYRAHIEAFIIRAKKIGTSVIAIPIAPATSEFIKKSPHISENIERYNSILYALEKIYDNVFIIDPFLNVISIDNIMLDELHPNEKGSELIAESVIQFLLKISKQ